MASNKHFSLVHHVFGAVENHLNEHRMVHTASCNGEWESGGEILMYRSNASRCTAPNHKSHECDGDAMQDLATMIARANSGATVTGRRGKGRL
jgi:hypothetical protein